MCHLQRENSCYKDVSHWAFGFNLSTHMILHFNNCDILDSLFSLRKWSQNVFLTKAKETYYYSFMSTYKSMCDKFP